MYVYGEEVFFVNFLMDLIISMFTSKILRLGKRVSRSFLCALIGGIYAVSVMYVKQNMFSQIAVCLIMGVILSGKDNQNILLTTLVLYICSILSGGGVIMVMRMSGKHLSGIFFTICVSMAILEIFFIVNMHIRNTETINHSVIMAILTHSGKTYTLKLYNDSGNLLTTAGGERITVIDQELFGEIFGNIYEKITYSPDISFVSAKTIAGEKVFHVLKADSLYIPETDKLISPAYVTSADIAQVRFDGIINLTGEKNAERIT